MTDLNTLTKLRGVIKSKLTRFKTFVSGFNIETGDLVDLSGRYERIQNLIDEFDDIQTKIELLLETSEISSKEREEFEESYFKCTALAKTLLKSKSSVVASNTTNISPSITHQVAKLPEIKLPFFDGKYNEWMSFRDTFESLVNSNSSLSNVDKFQYLKTAMRGDAARVISSIAISEQNYSIAWSKVVNRFEDKESIVLQHVKGLFEITPVTKESYSLLRQLADDISNHLEAIKTLDETNSLQDRLLIHLIGGKLDHVTKREWETKIASQKTPTADSLLRFIIDRSKLLEKLNSERQQIPKQSTRFSYNNPTNKQTKSPSFNYAAIHKPTCIFCKNSHNIYACQAFISLPTPSKLVEVKRLNLCFNCLKHGHSERECRMTSNCKTCHKRHHTLLHLQNTQEQSVNQESISCTNSNPTLTHCASSSHSATLLATATVAVVDHSGTEHQCRVLLDSGSQSNFITESFCNKINLPRSKTLIPVSGIGQSSTNVYYNTVIKLKSIINNFEVKTSCLIISKLTESLPSEPIDIINLQIPPYIQLADPKFHIPNKIDFLIGANLFWELLSVGQIKLPNVPLILQNTKLGWVASGQCNVSVSTVTCNVSLNEKLYNQISKFWELEKCENNKSILSREEYICENHYIQTTRRHTNGQFIVNIPFKANVSKLGLSHQIALRRFYTLETKLNKNPQIKQEYIKFMQEYEQLGHMTVLVDNALENGYYLPHHAVCKESSTTTKLRVVFDGSCKTSSGLSLNDVQMTGPPLQNDILHILLRFRQHRYVIKADIAKMYRQILVDDAQRDYQKIFWRSSEVDPVKSYRLNTVTYGTASAPFLAIRTIKQLAIEHQLKSPNISNILDKDFYVDDLLTGAETINAIVEIRQKISNILATAGFELRKWESNIRDNSVNTNDNFTPKSLLSQETESKTLGILWDSSLDQLHYDIKVNIHNPITKRAILSVIAQIFDPLGLVGPVVIKAKIILQKLWQISLGWDELIPLHLVNEWQNFIDGLSELKQVAVPRKVIGNGCKLIELHGFCDASEVAYGACVYLKSTDVSDSAIVNLLCAKSRVAPLKQVSLPRLELCGALLLARLIKIIKNSISIKIHRSICWSDSTITLAWLSGSAARWKQFVAHRVSEIQELTPESVWRHVPTTQNPADLISRGLKSHQLKNSRLWWKGPEYLMQNESLWPNLSSNITCELPETKLNYMFHSVCDSSKCFDLIERYSCINKLRRVTAYLLRFIENCRSHKDKTSRPTLGPLTVLELHKAEILLIRIVQHSEFNYEIQSLIRNKEISRRSKILSLSPFLDEDNILRVAGRLKNSAFTIDQKHPIILPGSHPFTALIIKNEHVRLMHAGSSTTLASIRTKYWPISGRNSVRQIIKKCIICLRNSPKIPSPFMGDLPFYRVTPCRPFLRTGVDYAGPFLVKEGKYKRAKFMKVYISIFVCMVTKAVHIEVVSSLTTEAFLGALHRFIARRGMITDIYSDNGKNFVGANNELKNLKSLFEKEINGTEIVASLVNNGIAWHFIPPGTPHFGGIWEASVKSVKNHMKRIIGNANLNFESLVTVLTQIEAILNSRPLTPVSNDPNDLSCLTPGHFLIGDTLLAPAYPDVSRIPDNRLSQWQHTQKLRQHFWERWNKEYISLLQQRNKWKIKTDNLKVGQLVLIKEDNLPPLKWLMGRVTQLHPGTDGIVRVVSLKTIQSVIKRAVTRLCVLPIDSEV